MLAGSAPNCAMIGAAGGGGHAVPHGHGVEPTLGELAAVAGRGGPQHGSTLSFQGLGLRRQDDWKLSGPFGFFGDTLTVHFSEAIFVLVGKVVVGVA